MSFAAPATAVAGFRGRWRLALAGWLAGTAAVLALAWAAPSGIARLDFLAYDLMLPTRSSAAEPAVIVAIDDESLANLGRWPWPRATHAAMVRQLQAAGAAVIGLDVMFNESDAADPAGDAALADAMQRHGRVVLPLAPVLLPDGRIAEAAPAAPFAASAALLGHVDAEVDADGQVRRMFLRAGVGEARHAAFGLAMANLLAPPSADAVLPGLHRDAQGAAPPAASWVRDAQVLLPRAPAQPRISFLHALRSPELLSGLKGRAVFIGVTAAGLGAELPSPVEGTTSTMPAVALHANVFNALRSNTLITPATWGMQWAFALLCVCGAALGALRGLPQRPWMAAAIVCVPILTSWLLLTAAQLWLPPAIATLGLLVACGVWLAITWRASRQQLTRVRQHAGATLDAISDGVLTVDPRLTVHYANPVVRQQAQGKSLSGAGLAETLALVPDSLSLLTSAVQECLRTANTVRITSHLLQQPAQGGQRSLRASVNPLRGPSGQLDGAVIVLADVTDAVRSANRLQHAATHDGLTDLPNRVLLQQRLELAMARVQRHGSKVAIFFLDLDRFKRINDSLGHQLGDVVLKVVAQRLGAMCRSTDFVARWGGDEFVVVMEDVSGPEVVAIAAAKLVAVLGEDIDAGGTRVASSCSVGVVMAPQDGTEIDLLLAKADTAMYRAKSHPDAGFHFYSSELRIWTRDRLSLEVELRQALRDGNFELYYQPQYELRNATLVGFEALLRWWRTPKTLVQPDDFICVAEETGLIVQIGAWVVRQAATDLASWLRDGRPALPIAVNVSARQCVNRNIVDVVRQALQETGIPPGLLTLEITETTAMTDAAKVVELLEEIKALGVRIAVDDFGTGYSSLAYLKRFPIDELKIDRSFVQDITTNSDDAAIVRATIALAHELGIMVVAEGVETAQQSAFLAAQGCDVGQGFFYGRPHPQLRSK